MTASSRLEGQLLDANASRAGGVRGPLRATWDRIKGTVTSRPSVPALVFGIWFVIALGALLWMWGLDPKVFPSPDEAVVRYAAQVIRDHGHPFLRLPFPDPEDLAHPRSWVTLGDNAVPTYAPVSLYAFGALLHLGRFGLLLVMVLPASAVAAFAAGVAHLLPEGRRWIALLAPPLGFPALYWLMRPWVNISPTLAFLAWALFFWARWRRAEQLRELCLAALAVGAAAAIRPDYAAFLLLAALMVSLAASPRLWQRSFIVFTLAGACALGANMIFNKILTGHPLQAAYQVALNRQWGAQAAGGAPGISGALHVLLVPMGWPDPKIAATTFVKYWVSMGPVLALLVAQLAVIPLLTTKTWFARVMLGLTVLLCAFFVYTRLHDDVFGGDSRIGWAEHSVPRYLTPVYLFAALPPLLLLGRAKSWRTLLPGLVVVCAMAGAGLYEIAWREPSSFSFVHAFVQKSDVILEELKAEIPATAMVYTVTADKLMWSLWRLGTIDDLELSAASMARAVGAGFTVYMVDSKYGLPSHRRLGVYLSRRRLQLVPVDGRRGVYRLREARGGWPRRP